MVTNSASLSFGDAHFATPGRELRGFLQQVIDLAIQRGRRRCPDPSHHLILDTLAASAHQDPLESII
jgi:hypothetical protein